MKRIDRIAETLRRVGGELTAAEVAKLVGTTRANASHDLNRLADLGMVEKLPGRPVRFRWRGEPAGTAATADGRDGAWTRDVGIFDRITGARGSLAKQVEQARAAILYPPRGLHTLLLGSTGVGKTLFAELMYQFALESGRLPPDAPFVAFNCADYAANPQLLMGQLFGVARGAFSGADRDRPGLVEKADGGILFLDEVHRLPPEGQEMLFYLIDRGEYRRLGEAERVRRSSVLLIAATTEPPESALLSTFYRRIPMVIHLPDLRDRPVEERRELIHRFVLEEQERIGVRVVLSPDALELLLRYECPGNIGQLRTDIQLACAHAYLNYLSGKSRVVWIAPDALPEHVRRGAGPGVS
ncbi:MAG: sigma 54-interacting transcriptional regulator, partial [Bacillota bacterium]